MVKLSGSPNLVFLSSNSLGNFRSMIPSEADLIFSQYRKCLSSLLYSLYSLDVAVAGTSVGLVGIFGCPTAVPIRPWYVLRSSANQAYPPLYLEQGTCASAVPSNSLNLMM